MKNRSIVQAILLGVLLIGCSQTDEPAIATNQIDPMTAYGTTASNVFFYYEDVEAAMTFYKDVMGFRVAAVREIEVDARRGR